MFEYECNGCGKRFKTTLDCTTHPWPGCGSSSIIECVDRRSLAVRTKDSFDLYSWAALQDGKRSYAAESLLYKETKEEIEYAQEQEHKSASSDGSDGSDDS